MEADDIEIFRQKKLLKYLRDARGNGTSMISLIIPPKDQLCRFSKMLTDEYGTATNIKSRVNRLSVLSAISSAQTKLKTYNNTPKNGLAIFVGTVLLDDNKEKKVSFGIEPIKPINTSLYMCDSRFHVEDLLGLFDDESKYGFVIIDGHGNHQNVIQYLTVDLPKKHGRGGQSSVRFARLRVEKRLAYVKKVSELITNYFITNSISNVEGIILGGLADLKNELLPFVDQRLTVIQTVDTNYGGRNGLNQAIEICEESLKDVKFSKEKRVLQDFLYEVNMNTGKYCYGLAGTMGCLESGAVELLIIWENSPLMHEDELFVDWITENYKNYGCKLFFVSDRSGEGAQFVEGFGGIGGILRYKVDMEDYDENELNSFSDDEDIF